MKRTIEYSTETFRKFQKLSDFFNFLDLGQVDKIEPRTLLFIKHYGRLKDEAKFSNNAELAELLGIKSISTISEILGRRQNIQPKHWNKFKEHFGITENSVPRETGVEEPDVEIDRKIQNYQESRRDRKLATQPFLVPLVPVKAQAGYANKFDSSAFISQLEMYPILPGIDPRGAVWRYFEVQGDSMEPDLFDTDLVLVSMVPPEDWKDLKVNQVYVIVTNDDVWVKIVQKKEKHQWILGSSNKRHKQRAVPVADIKEIWRYRRHVTNRLQPLKP